MIDDHRVKFLGVLPSVTTQFGIPNFPFYPGASYVRPFKYPGGSWPIPVTEGGPNPLPVYLQDIASMYWRVRKWKVTHNFPGFRGLSLPSEWSPDGTLVDERAWEFTLSDDDSVVGGPDKVFYTPPNERHLVLANPLAVPSNTAGNAWASRTNQGLYEDTGVPTGFYGGLLNFREVYNDVEHVGSDPGSYRTDLNVKIDLLGDEYVRAELGEFKEWYPHLVASAKFGYSSTFEIGPGGPEYTFTATYGGEFTTNWEGLHDSPTGAKFNIKFNTLVINPSGKIDVVPRLVSIPAYAHAYGWDNPTATVGGGVRIDEDLDLTITMEAVEYWPYANSKGKPIYDTGSGYLMNDPLS